MIGTFFGKLKFLFNSPMVIFVFTIIKKWYLAIMITAFVVVYWVLKGLSDNGILENMQDVVFKAFDETKAVARYCVPKITNPSSFWRCLENPPSYKSTKEEKQLKESVDNLLNFNNYDASKDPYSSPSKSK